MHVLRRPAARGSLRPAPGNLVNLPEYGWGEMILTHSMPRAGSYWTDTGRPRQRRAPKHRADGDTRHVPIHPELAAMLREHLEEFGTGPRGRLFIGPRGGIITDRAYLKVFHEARAKALTAQEASSPLLEVPYALRHAAVSTWLNARVARHRSPNGPGTAWPSCCGSTPSASPANRTWPCGASSTPPRTNHPSPTRTTARTTMSRSQDRRGGRTFSAHPCPRQR